MANLTCPACDYNAHTNEEISSHIKSMTDDKHKEALKQGIGAKGGEAMNTAKDKASDAVSDLKNKI